MGKSSTGLAENDAGLLCYVLIWVSGLVFILLEQESKFVRFHAAQSVIVFGVLSIASAILSSIPVIGWIFGAGLGIVMLVLWIMLMVKAIRLSKLLTPFAHSSSMFIVHFTNGLLISSIFFHQNNTSLHA